MSSTNVNDTKEEPRQDLISNEEQSTSRGIRAQVNIKITVISDDSKEQDKDTGVNPNVTYTNETKIRSSRSLDELSKRLTDFECYEGTSTGIRKYASTYYMNIPQSSTTTLISSEGLDFLLLNAKERGEDEESFTTIEPCQKEKLIGTDVPTIFSVDNRTQNLLATRSIRDEQPPPYEAHMQSYPARITYPRQNEQPPAYNQEYYAVPPQDASRGASHRRNYFPIVEELFDNKAIRDQFVRKVYAILAVQLLFTFVFIVVCIYMKSVRNFVMKQRILSYVAMGVFIVLLLVLQCVQKARRIYPLNFFLLSLLTIAMAYMTAFISCYYSTHTVMVAIGVTAGICTLVSILSCTKWFDITKCSALLCMASIVVIIFGIISVIVTLLTHSNITFIIYAFVATILFCAYLMYDTQKILGGRRIELSPEEYILGAITLYVDIMIILQYVIILTNYLNR